MSYAQDREAFIARMAREFPDRDTLPDSRKLLAMANTHCRYATGYCNGDAWATRGACDEIGAKIKRLCAKIGVEPILSFDPRGCTVKIVVPSGYSDSWGGPPALCVPQR